MPSALHALEFQRAPKIHALCNSRRAQYTLDAAYSTGAADALRQNPLRTDYVQRARATSAPRAAHNT
eukprot:3769612-Lingulodinium_polyedra.AAC.1